MTRFPGIADESEAQQVLRQLAEVFIPDARLPAQVFRRPRSHYGFVEFDLIFNSGFWGPLRHITEHSGDGQCLAAVLDPDPNQHYRSHFGQFAVARFEASASPADYRRWNQVPPNGTSADALVHSANVMIHSSESAKWGLWAQRDLEIAVLGFDSTVLRPPNLQLFDASEALHNLTALAYPHQEVPQEVSAVLLEHYG